MKDSIERTVNSWRGSKGFRLLSVVFLALVLQIPISMIDGLVSEREARRQAAIEDVSSKWGNAQSITGPVLVLPYTYRWEEGVDGGKTVTRTESRNAFFLPEVLHVRGALDTDVRSRGIFSVPVYKLGLVVDGEFAAPSLADLDIKPNDVDWRKAHLAVGISDARAIQETTSLLWNGQQAAFLPGTGGFSERGTGIHAPIVLANGTNRVAFSFPLSLNGSTRVDVVPFGRNTIVELQGDNGNPSFQGAWLPTERTISADSFKAKWSIPFLGRSYPQAWTSATMKPGIDASRFGVELKDPVDHYRMTERSVKYAGLFIVLTFATLWLLEILAEVQVHPIQYLMLGGALCLFYLLELSLSEHIGFPFAYVSASAAVIAMVGAFGVVALQRVNRAIIVAGCVTVLYGYLYMLLMNEDYALLIGSIGLFAILGGIMYATRRVDWYAPAGGQPVSGSKLTETPV